MPNNTNQPANQNNDSHPLLQAAHVQGQGVLSHINGGGKTGSGITLGTAKKTCIGCNKPATGGKGGATSPILGPGAVKPTTGGSGGATAPILGPGGTNPSTGGSTGYIPRPNQPTISGKPTIVGPSGENPLGRAANRVVNSLWGTGSLNANQIHVTSIQNNLREAINDASGFNNLDLKNNLIAAQAAMNGLATAKDNATRAQLIQNAKNAFNAAHVQLANMGYNGGKNPVVPSNPNNSRLL